MISRPRLAVISRNSQKRDIWEVGTPVEEFYNAIAQFERPFLCCRGGVLVASHTDPRSSSLQFLDPTLSSLAPLSRWDKFLLRV
jgi:hypothetical protein